MLNFNQFRRIYENKNKILIKEGLIFSFSYSKFKNKLLKIIKNNKLSYEVIEINDDGLFLKKLKPNKSNKFFVELNSLLNVSGYYVSSYKKDDENVKHENVNIIDYMNSFEISYIFNKRFDFEETGIKTNLYHLTDKKHVKKILKNGLAPKSKKIIDNHPERIYLFDDSDDLEDFYENILGFIDNYKKVKLKINVKSLPKLKLYKDVKFPGYDAYYTYDNIPPYSIELID
jgi:hypothetical protein